MLAGQLAQPVLVNNWPASHLTVVVVVVTEVVDVMVVDVTDVVVVVIEVVVEVVVTEVVVVVVTVAVVVVVVVVSVQLSNPLALCRLSRLLTSAAAAAHTAASLPGTTITFPRHANSTALNP